MSSKAEVQRTTVVGIGAQGNAEDWSSEFDLEGGNLLKSPSFRSKLLNNQTEIKEVDFDDIVAQEDNIDFTDSDDDTLLATNDQNNYNKSKSTFADDIGICETDSLSEDEDWDEELGITDEVLESQESMLNGFRHVISDTLGLKHGGMLDELIKPVQLDDVVKTTIPARCKVVSMLLTRPDDFNMLVYPKSIPLYSLKLDGDKKQLMAMQLDDWLKNIVHKHKERIDQLMRAKDANWLREIQSKNKGFCRRLLNAWAEVITVLWRNNSLEVYDMVKNFLKVFRQFSKMDKYVVKDLSTMSEADYHMSFVQVVRVLRIAAMADVLESISGRYTDGAGKRNDHHFRMTITDNNHHAPTKTHKHGLSGQGPFFPEILKCATVLFPDKLELLAVLELEAASHHVCVMVDNRIDSNYSPTPYDLFKSHIFLYRSISSSTRERTASYNKLKSDKKTSRRDKDRYEEDMKNCDTATTAILCDLCLLLNGHESLNVQYSKHLAAAIDLIFVEKNNNDHSSDESDEDNEEFFDVYTQTQSKPVSKKKHMSSSNRSNASDNHSTSSHSKSHSNSHSNSRSNNSRSNNSLSHNSPLSPRAGRDKDSKKFQYHATHTTTESIDPDSKKQSGRSVSNKSTSNRSVSNNSKSVSNLLSISQHSKSSSKNYLSTRALSMELFENDDVPLFEVFVKLRTHRFLVATLLSKKYKKVSRKSPLKPVVAYTLGLLQSLEEDTPGAQERTESLWLECLVLLDKQFDPRNSEVAPPIVSFFAVGVIEAFAELLIKTSKYKFGVSSFEAVTECLLLLNSKDVKRLYRRLTNVSTEARDIKRSIYYHCVMLRIAIEEGKLNEFVYIADLVGKLFLEMGETQLAERCLRVVALLHQGYTIKSVRFERISLDKLLLNSLPDGIEVPYIDFKTDTETVPVASVPGALLWARRAKDSVQCDSQQLHAIMKLVEAYVVSDYHQMALALCSCLLEKKVFPQGRIYVLMTMAKCFLKLRQLKKCEATLDRIAYEADEIVTPLLNTGDETPSPEQEGTGRGGFRGSLAYGQPHNNSFSGQIEPTSRRDVMKLSRISSENRKSKNITRSGSINFFNNDSHPSHHHTSAALLGVVTKVRSYQYVLLRARCRLAADDPEWAILWLQIAMSICPRGKFDRRGRIRYLTGRSYMLLCQRCHMGGGAVPSDLVEQEALYAKKAEEEFRAASTLYKLTGDIVKETKTLSRITELHISRVFSEVAVEQSAPLQQALHGKAESTVRSLESLSRLAMQLAGDTSAPLELIRTLVNTSELSWLVGNVQLSFSAWYEAKTLLNITYLQCLSVDTSPPPNLSLHLQSVPSNGLPAQKIKKTFSFGSLNSLNTNTPAMNSFSPAEFIPDPLNPLADAPLPAVKFAPGMLLRIYALLTRVVRLAFVIEPCPLSHYGGNLLASWIRMNNAVSAMGTPLFSDMHASLKKSISSFHDICSCYHHASADFGFKSKYGFSSEMLDVLTYFSPEPSERLVLIEKLVKNSSKTGEDVSGSPSEKKRKSSRESKRSPGDVVVDKDIAVAGLNILQPFELMLRAFSVDGAEGVEADGAQATEVVLNYVRGSVCSGLLQPRGEKAGHVITRGLAPGVTMTAAGHFVEGAMDYQAAEIFVKKHDEHYSATKKHHDLNELLKRHNDVYSPSDGYLLSESNVFYSSDPHTGETTERDPNTENDSGQLEDTMALLLGSHPKKSRIQVLFLRLKSFSEQYSLGHLSLTDYYRNNMDTLRSIVNAQNAIEDLYGTLTVKDERVDRVMLSRSFSTPFSPSVAPSAPTQPKPGNNKRSLVRSQTKEVMDQLEGGQDNDEHIDELRKCFAPSFRFVIQLEPNTLLLYVPRTNVTATALFRSQDGDRDKEHGDRSCSSSSMESPPISLTRDLTAFLPFQDFHRKSDSGQRDRRRSAELRSVPPPPALPPPPSPLKSLSQQSSDERCAFDDIYAVRRSDSFSPPTGGGLVLDLPTTLTPSKVEQQFYNPMSLEAGGASMGGGGGGGVMGNSVEDNAQSNNNPTNMSNTMVSALTLDASFNVANVDKYVNLMLNGLLNATHSLTSPVCPLYAWSDSAVLSAYNSLPLPTEDIREVKKEGVEDTFEEKVKEANDRAHAHEEEKYSVNELLSTFGLQKVMFLVNALMLEEPVLLLIAPGSEQLLVHVATALLRLLRPLQWQHLYLPLMHSTLYPQFRTLIENHDIFLVGSYHQVLAPEVEAYRAISSKLFLDKDKIDPFCLPRLSHVTIADLNSGRIKPSSNMVFAHICTVFDPYAHDIPVGDAGITAPMFFPEAANNPLFRAEQLPGWAVEREAQLRFQEADLEDTDDLLTFRKHHSIEKINSPSSSRNLFDMYVKNKGHSSSSYVSDDESVGSAPEVLPPMVLNVRMKPPIPVRYRSHIYERLYAVLFGLHLSQPVSDILSKPFERHLGSGGRTSPKHKAQQVLSLDVQMECSAVLLEAMFQVMISMFKGVKCFLRPASSLIPAVGHALSSSRIQGPPEARVARGSFKTRRAMKTAAQTKLSKPYQQSYAQQMFALSDPPGGYACQACQALEVVPGDKNLKMKTNSKLSKLLENGVVTQAKRNDGLSLPAMDEKQWVSFLRDDCQSFARHILHTTSFKLFCRDVALCQQNHQKHGRNKRFHVSEYFYAFMLRSHEKIRHKMTIYRTMSTHRVAGYMITYFGRIDAQLESQFGEDDDNDSCYEYGGYGADMFDVGANLNDGETLKTVPFLHTFPFTPPRVKASLKTITNAKKEPPLKIKRRWCVLDSQRFTYYKSRSSTAAKNYISMDPSQVRLVMAPFNHHPQRLHFASTAAESSLSGESASKVIENNSNMTTISDAFALVCSAFVVILRAENLADHNKWLLAFRSRLMSADAVNSNLSRHDSYKDTTGLLSAKDAVPKIALSSTLKQKLNNTNNASTSPIMPDRVFKYKNPDTMQSRPMSMTHHRDREKDKERDRSHDDTVAHHRQQQQRRPQSFSNGRHSHGGADSDAKAKESSTRRHERPGQLLRGVIPTTKNTRESRERERESSGGGHRGDRDRQRSSERNNHKRQSQPRKGSSGDKADTKYRSSATRRDNGGRHS